jgi:hypothetical protein
MFCRNCGKELTGSPEFCMNCGAKPMAGTSFCLGCGAPTTPLTEICTNCGAQVAKAIKEKTWKPTAAGILCIIAGAIGLVPVIAVAVLFGGLSSIIGGIPFIIFATLIPLILFGIMPIVGGIYALRRRRWGLALAGSICCPLVGFVILGFYFLFVITANVAVWPDTPTSGAMIPMIIGFIVGFVIFGILPIVFVILGKREFK